MRVKIGALIVALFAVSSAAFAQEALSLKQYLDSVNYEFVSFEGEMAYDRREDNFRIRTDEGYFSAVIDAGRELREQVQRECERSAFGYEGGCIVVGQGTVEIRGSNLWISVETLSSIQLID